VTELDFLRVLREAEPPLALADTRVPPSPADTIRRQPPPEGRAHRPAVTSQNPGTLDAKSRPGNDAESVTQKILSSAPHIRTIRGAISTKKNPLIKIFFGLIKYKRRLPDVIISSKSMRVKDKQNQ